MMGALGSALFVVSQAIGQIAPSIAVDISLLAVFIAGIYAGPRAGFATGLIAGLIPGIMFGPLGAGGVIGFIAIPLGKSFTGLTIGLLAAQIKTNRNLIRALICMPLTWIAYIPEGIFTYVYFTQILTRIADMPPTVAAGVASTVLIKAIIEVVVMSNIIAILGYHKGVNNFIETHFHKPKTIKQQQ
jgi:hypothetical protein